MLEKKNINALLLFLIGITLYSCGRTSENMITEYASMEASIVSNAERFSLKKRAGYTELTIINPWQGAKGVNNIHYLVRKDKELPEGIDTSKVIRVPLKSIICMSTSHIAMIEALGEEKTISGVSGTGFIYSEILRERVENGIIKDVGYDAGLNKELIFSISPDVIMIYGVGSETTGYMGKIEEMGIKVLFNADYLEKDPLARAEWIKLFGALYCKEHIADSIYKNEVEAYKTIKSYIVNKITERPRVLLGLPFKDTWFISPGNSFISKLIYDAGGVYLWHDTESQISMPFGIENVYMKALHADYWLNIGTVKSKKEIAAIDPRLQDLPCYKKGNLYNNNKRITEEGGNDYWEAGSVFPHLILKDIASILHPGIFDNYDLRFYKKLDKKNKIGNR